MELFAKHSRGEGPFTVVLDLNDKRKEYKTLTWQSPYIAWS